MEQEFCRQTLDDLIASALSSLVFGYLCHEQWNDIFSISGVSYNPKRHIYKLPLEKLASIARDLQDLNWFAFALPDLCFQKSSLPYFYLDIAS